MGTELNNNLEAMFGKLENFVSTKTVVGEPVEIGGVIIIPLVDVTFGLAGGANDNKPDEKSKKEGSIGGLGAKIAPSAVLVIMNGSVQLVNVKNQDSINKLIDMVPGVLSKLNFGSFFSKKESGAEAVRNEAMKEKFEKVSVTEETINAAEKTEI